MKVHLTLDQLVQILLDHEELEGDRLTLADCLQDITDSIVFSAEQATAREFNVKAVIQSSIKRLRVSNVHG